MKHSWTNSLNLSSSLEWRIVVLREVKYCNVIAGGEEPRLYVHCMLNKWLWIIVCFFWVSDCEACCAMRCKLLWIMVSYAEAVVVTHGEICWASGCQPRCALLSHWLWIIVSNAEPVVVNYCALSRAECVGIMVCYAEPLVVNHGVLFPAIICEP
jgi:hypothetical protein